MAMKIKVHERFSEASNIKTVQIGDQVWMAENLNVDDGGEGIYKNPKNGEYYYTWEAAMRIAEATPSWHVPSAQEWADAALACGAEKVSDRSPDDRADYKNAQELDDKLDTVWAGYRNFGSFLHVGTFAPFWTSTEHSPTRAYYRVFSADAEDVYLSSSVDNKLNYAYSVRLVKD